MATHFIAMATPINDIDGKSHKGEMKSSRNYSINHIKSKSRHKLFMAAEVYAYTYTYTFAHESDFKKLGARQLQHLCEFIVRGFYRL